MWLSAFQAQAPFLGMELTCSAAGSCMGKLFENWYPAYCSSHCYNYFFVSPGKHIVWHRKTRGQNSHLFKKKILLCPGSVNRLFLPTRHPFFLLLLMHNYFLGGRGSSLSATTPDSRLRTWHRAPIDIFHFLGQSDAQMTYGEWIVNFIETNKPCLLLFPCLTLFCSTFYYPMSCFSICILLVFSIGMEVPFRQGRRCIGLSYAPL